MPELPKHEFHREHYTNRCYYCKDSEWSDIHKVPSSNPAVSENDKMLLHARLEDKLAHIVDWHGPSVYTIIDEIARQGWTPPERKEDKDVKRWTVFSSIGTIWKALKSRRSSSR